MKLKVLIFIVAYNAEKTIVNVLKRIPKKLSENYDLSILIIDDASQDNTKEIAEYFLTQGYWCKTHILKNQLNQGYGGNQKLGYQYAINNRFDVVALLHGDGQYAPEELPGLIKPFTMKNAPGAVFGSRMIFAKNAIKGGMPYYKFVGNKILTTFQNLLLGSKLSEFHSGFRLYNVETLKNIPFKLNTNDFHFDTEIIVQLFAFGSQVIELPIPTYYGDEKCHVNGMKYAWDVIKTSMKARIIMMGIFYDPKFSFDQTHIRNRINTLNFLSLDNLIFKKIENDSVILDLSYEKNTLMDALKKHKNCRIISVKDPLNLDKKIFTKEYMGQIDYILVLDQINRIDYPESFLKKIREHLNKNTHIPIIVSSANIGFFITRFMLMLGYFNYARRGILDIEHKRLFTLKSLEQFFKYQGFQITNKVYLPGPYPLAIKLNVLSKILIKINSFLIKISPGLFSYQMFYSVKSTPETEWLLQQAISKSKRSLT
jgi:glycosyltransferase involved in cell wall biosynthesis